MDCTQTLSVAWQVVPEAMAPCALCTSKFVSWSLWISDGVRLWAMNHLIAKREAAVASQKIQSDTSCCDTFENDCPMFLTVLPNYDKVVKSSPVEKNGAFRNCRRQSSLEPLAFLSTSCIECKSSDNARCPFTLSLAKTLSGLELSRCASVSLILGLKGGQLDSCQCCKDV